MNSVARYARDVFASLIVLAILRVALFGMPRAVPQLIRDVLPRLPATLDVCALAVAIAAVVGIPLGMIAGRYKIASRIVAAASAIVDSSFFVWVVLYLQVALVESNIVSYDRAPTVLVFLAGTLALFAVPSMALAGRALATSGWRALLPSRLGIAWFLSLLVVAEVINAWYGVGRVFRDYSPYGRFAGIAFVVSIFAVFTLVVGRGEAISGPVMLRSVRRTRTALVSGALICVVLLALGAMSDRANFIDNVHWIGNPLPPCFQVSTLCGGHLLGTDEVGRDELYRLLVGARLSIGIPAFGVAIGIALTAVLVTIARRLPLLRWLLLRLHDTVSSVMIWPLLALLVARIWKLPTLLILTVFIGLVAGVLLLRDALMEKPRAPLIRASLMLFERAIFVVATLDFFGYADLRLLPLPSWGNMLVNAQADMYAAWWIPLFPGLALLLTGLLLRSLGAYLFMPVIDRATTPPQ